PGQAGETGNQGGPKSPAPLPGGGDAGRAQPASDQAGNRPLAPDQGPDGAAGPSPGGGPALRAPQPGAADRPLGGRTQLQAPHHGRASGVQGAAPPGQALGRLPGCFSFQLEKGKAQTLSWRLDRKSTRLNSSHVKISYAVFCLKKKKKNQVIKYEHLNELSQLRHNI